MQKLAYIAAALLGACPGVLWAGALDQLKTLSTLEESTPEFRSDATVVPAGLYVFGAYVGEAETEIITRRAGQDAFSSAMEVRIYKVWPKRREYSHTIRAPFSVQVRNAPLLRSESESIQVTYDGFKFVVIPDERYNRYQVAKYGDSEFVLAGERRLAAPNNSLAVQVDVAGGDVLLRVTDGDYQPGLDNPQAQTVAVLSVRTPQAMWRDKEVANIRVSLTDGKAEVALNRYAGSALPPGSVYYIEYRLARINSRFNNSSESSTLYTPKFTR